MAPNQSMRSGMEALKSDGQRGDKADDDEDAEQVQGGKGIAQSEGRNPYLRVFGDNGHVEYVVLGRANGTRVAGAVINDT